MNGYDANSNRTAFTLNASSFGYNVEPTSNRLLATTGPVAKSYTYDAAGHSTSDGTNSFTWNAAGRLSQALTPSGTAAYQYNGKGERVAKTTAAGTTRFF
jgi:YD repeat-containing protein